MSPQREYRLARTIVFLVVVAVFVGFGLALMTAPDAHSSNYRWGPPATSCADCRAGG